MLALRCLQFVVQSGHLLLTSIQLHLQQFTLIQQFLLKSLPLRTVICHLCLFPLFIVFFSDSLWRVIPLLLLQLFHLSCMLSSMIVSVVDSRFHNSLCQTICPHLSSHTGLQLLLDFQLRHLWVFSPSGTVVLLLRRVYLLS